jgi:hypothetical protein
MKSTFKISRSVVSLDVVVNVFSFFSLTRHPFSFNHFEVAEVFVEEAEDEDSIVIPGTSSSVSLAGEKHDGLCVRVFAR